MHARDGDGGRPAGEDGLIVQPTFEYRPMRQKVDHRMLDTVWCRRMPRLRECRRKTPFRVLAMPSALAYPAAMGDLDRLVPSGIIEQWVYHLRRQRSRATDAIWLIDQGFTLHDGQDGVPQHDATERWRAEQETVVAEVTALLALYDGINLGKVDVA